MTALQWKTVGIVLLILGVLTLLLSQIIISWRHKKSMKE